MPRRQTYNTQPDQCDVEDRTALAAYREKRTQWLDWLKGDDVHSISRQILAMSANYITFRVCNEALRLAVRRDFPSPIRNGPLFRFLTTGFITTQALAIRRLQERAAQNPKRQVVSLRRLVDDIEAHRLLITREIFIAHDGQPYDAEAANDQFMASYLAKYPNGGRTVYMPGRGPGAWVLSDRMHRAFDRLANCSSPERTRFDRIQPAVFSKLRELLDDSVIERVRLLANKWVAHAADQDSRAAVSGLEGMCLDDIDDAHRNLTVVANFVSSFLLYESNLSPVAAPQFDVFEHVESAGFDKEACAKLHRLSGALVDRRDRWAREAVDVILAED